MIVAKKTGAELFLKNVKRFKVAILWHISHMRSGTLTRHSALIASKLLAHPPPAKTLCFPMLSPLNPEGGEGEGV